MQAFLGSIPGSLGETSTLACLIGAAFLIYTGIASWRIIVGVIAGMVLTASLFKESRTDQAREGRRLSQRTGD